MSIYITKEKKEIMCDMHEEINSCNVYNDDDW